MLEREFQAADGSSLSQRFQMQVRALQGEYSPANEECDTEHSEGCILEGLVGFPCSMPVKVVINAPAEAGATLPRSISDGVQALVGELCEICEEVGMKPSGLEVVPRLGGKVLSVAFDVRAESAAALSALRERIRADDRVRMVF